MRKVAFIGLGTQGKPLARNLIATGVDLMVSDLNPEPVQELAAQGARAATSLTDIAAHADIVFVCVVNDAQVEALLTGPDGLLARLRRGAVVAVHSTVTPATVLKLGKAAAALGVGLIDAPVSGGAAGAAARNMSFMVGGDLAAFAKCEPLMRLSGERITHTGALGTAAAAKLVHQVVLCLNMMAMAEGVRLAEAAGLDLDVTKTIVREGAAQSRIAELWGDIDVAPRAEPIFYKDLMIGLAVARELGVTLPGTALCQQSLGWVLPTKRVGSSK